MQNGYGNLNIGRRHSNIQKGVQQNGVGNRNIQKDEFGWRRGKVHTVDVQENVTQNGIGKKNDKSLRRINEMMRNLLNNESGNKRKGRKRLRNGNRRNNRTKQAKPSRRNGNQNHKEQLHKNQIDKFTDRSKTLQEQVDALKTMLCKTVKNLCDYTNDKPTRQTIGDRNSRRISVSQSANPSRYNRRPPSILDKYDEIIFLPNFEIVLK